MSGFEPDWNALGRCIQNLRLAMPSEQAKYVVEKYLDQAEAAGLVMVRGEDLVECMAYAANPKRLHTAKSIAAWERMLATLNTLAATLAPTPGGDA